MSGIPRRTFGTAALIVLLSAPGRTQAPAVDAIVAEFYPQSLVALGERTGEPFARTQCHAVFDTESSGAPRTIVAAYTNGSSAAIRVLRASGAGAFEVVAEPLGYDLFGSECEVSLVDLDHDGRNDLFIRFRMMVNDVSWAFKWDGQQLFNVTPVTEDVDGTLRTRFHGASVVDIDNDGVKEIYVVSQYPPPPNEPARADILFRLAGEQYVQDQPVIGLWGFERKTGAPVTDRVQASLPKGALGPFTLHVVNGTDGGRLRATSAQVWLNDRQILGPSDFGKNAAFIDRRVTLGAENELTVRLAGAPGSRVLIVLKSEAWAP